uniref:Putative secreted protein n=1 Tax=Panstrongylus lignarius TaxID=156445 RepID=A0A224Y008_9HEMI
MAPPDTVLSTGVVALLFLGRVRSSVAEFDNTAPPRCNLIETLLSWPPSPAVITRPRPPDAVVGLEFAGSAKAGLLLRWAPLAARSPGPILTVILAPVPVPPVPTAPPPDAPRASSPPAPRLPPNLSIFQSNT